METPRIMDSLTRQSDPIEAKTTIYTVSRAEPWRRYLYHLSGLRVKRRQRHKGLAIERLLLLRPNVPNLT